MSFLPIVGRNLVVIIIRFLPAIPGCLQIHLFATDEHGFSQIV